MALYGSLVPSEIDGLKTIVDGLPAVKSSSDSDSSSTSSDVQAEATKALAEIRNAISIEGDDLEFTEDAMVEGQVTRVTATKGTITPTIDEDKLMDATTRQTPPRRLRNLSHQHHAQEDRLGQLNLAD